MTEFLASCVLSQWESLAAHYHAGFVEVSLYNSLKRLSNAYDNADMYISDIMTYTCYLRHVDVIKLMKDSRYNATLQFPLRTIYLSSSSKPFSVFIDIWYEIPSIVTCLDYYAWERINIPRLVSKMPQITCASFISYSDSTKNTTMAIAASDIVDNQMISPFRQMLTQFFQDAMRPDLVIIPLTRSLIGRRRHLLTRLNTIHPVYRCSRFGFVPAGDTPTSSRFYDMLRTSTIPILLSDHFTIPFESLYFDSASICAQFPMHDFNAIWRGINLITNWKEQCILHGIEASRLLFDIAPNDTSPLLMGHQEWGHMWQFAFILISKAQSERQIAFSLD